MAAGCEQRLSWREGASQHTAWVRLVLELYATSCAFECANSTSAGSDGHQGAIVGDAERDHIVVELPRPNRRQLGRRGREASGCHPRFLHPVAPGGKADTESIAMKLQTCRARWRGVAT